MGEGGRVTLRCSCGDDKCHQAISISGGRENVIRVWNNEGDELMMYIDANFLVKLIGEAKEALKAMTDYAGEN